MTHRDRIEAVLHGQKPDRMPVSFWRHFYDSESSTEQLAKAMLRFQRKFDWDFMKINPRGSYYVEAWGNEYVYSGSADDKPRRVAAAVMHKDDWQRIGKLDPLREETLAEQINAVRMIRELASDSLPIVMTIFNPISIAGDLVPEDNFLVTEIRNNPKSLHKALENITLTFVIFAREILKAGADGIFLATTQWASTDLITVDEYREFGRKYDLRILEEIAASAWLRIMHVCSGNNMLALFADYPVDIINWDMHAHANPDALSGSKMLPDKVIMGGVDKDDQLQNGSQMELEKMVERNFEFSRNCPFILAPNCTIPITTPDENLKIIKDKIDQLTY